MALREKQISVNDEQNAAPVKESWSTANYANYKFDSSIGSTPILEADEPHDVDKKKDDDEPMTKVSEAEDKDSEKKDMAEANEADDKDSEKKDMAEAEDEDDKHSEKKDMAEAEDEDDKHSEKKDMAEADEEDKDDKNVEVKMDDDTLELDLSDLVDDDEEVIELEMEPEEVSDEDDEDDDDEEDENDYMMASENDEEESKKEDDLKIDVEEQEAEAPAENDDEEAMSEVYDDKAEEEEKKDEGKDKEMAAEAEDGEMKQHDEEKEEEDEKKKEDAKPMAESKLKISFKIDETNKLFENNEVLTETDKRQSRALFESAVRSSAKQISKQLQEAYQARFEEFKKQHETKTATQVDQYMSYVVEQWVKDNKVSLQSQLRNRLSDSFINGLKKLFTEHYIEVPQSKVNVVEALAKNVKSLKVRLKESEAKAVKLHTEMKEAVTRERLALRKEHKARLIAEAASAVTSADRGAFVERAETVKFSNTKEFKTTLVALREQYFGAKKSTERSTNEPVAVPNFEPKKSSSTVDIYAQVADRFTGRS